MSGGDGLFEVDPAAVVTKPGRAAYAQRKTIVEPVFGQVGTSGLAAAPA